MANRTHLALLLSSTTEWNAWRQEEPQTKPDLTGADLSHRNLRHVNFSECDFTGCNLRETDFYECDFTNAVLKDCVVARTRGLPRAKPAVSPPELLRRSVAEFNAWRSGLTEEDLYDSTLFDFSFQDFSGWNLAGANLTHLNFQSVDFSNADLSGACFGGDTNLAGVELKGACLQDTTFDEDAISSLTDEQLLLIIRAGVALDLAERDLAENDLTDIDFTKCTNTDGLNLQSCIFHNTRFFGSQLSTEVDLTGAHGTIVLVPEPKKVKPW